MAFLKLGLRTKTGHGSTLISELTTIQRILIPGKIRVASDNPPVLAPEAFLPLLLQCLIRISGALGSLSFHPIHRVRT